MTVNKTLTQEKREGIKKTLNQSDFAHFQKKLENLVIKYHDVVALSDDELGHCNLFSHQIKIQPGAQVIHKRPYRSPHSFRKIVDKEIEKLHNQGVVEPSKSPWSAPLLLVTKKDGSHRVVVDYRELNSITTPDRYPIPSIHEALNALKGAKIFSALDLKSGFFQISMDEKSRPLTAFATASGHWQFARMAMGLKNSPSTFQRMMNSILAGMDAHGVLLYLDDVLVYSPNLEEHFKTLENVFSRLQETGLTLSLKKSVFMMRKIKYLGHEISPEGVSPDKDKIDKLPNWPIPKTPKQVKSYLGFAGYFRSFVPNYAETTKPLTNLTKKDVPFNWDSECQESFGTLNKMLQEAQQLRYPDFKKPFYVVTDASKKALGAVLMQKSEDGKRLHPIEYASKSLDSAQAKYSTTDLEALAVDFGLSKFRYVIFGYEVIVATDHRPLLSIFKTRDLNDYSNRMTRLIMRVQNYDPRITFVKGKDNNLADYLSRQIPEKAISYNVDSISIDSVCNNFSSEELIKEQTADPHYGPIRSKIKEGKPLDKKETIKKKTFLIIDEALVIKDNNRNGQLRYRVVIPQSLELDTIKLHHDVYPHSHPSCERTRDIIQKTFFFKNLSSKVSDYIASCPTCIRYKGNQHPPTPYHYYPVPDTPFDKVHMDFVGPLNKTREGNKYLLVFIDYTTRYIVLDALPNRTADNVAVSLFRKILMPHSAPKVLISDNALEFISSVVEALCEMYKVRKVEITSRTPHANGVCERANKSIISALKSLVNEREDDWDEKLVICEACINSAYHQSLGDTPYFCLYGRDKRNPFEKFLDKPRVNYNIEDVPITLFQIHQNILNKVNQHLRASQENYMSQSRKRTKPRTLQPGDRVFIQYVSKPGKSRKLNPKWVGPYRVISLEKHDRIKIRSILHSTSEPFSIHVNRTKVVRQRDADPSTIPKARDVYPSEDDLRSLPTIINDDDLPMGSEAEIEITHAIPEAATPIANPEIIVTPPKESTPPRVIVTPPEEDSISSPEANNDPIQNPDQELVNELSPQNRLRSMGFAQRREVSPRKRKPK